MIPSAVLTIALLLNASVVPWPEKTIVWGRVHAREMAALEAAQMLASYPWNVCDEKNCDGYLFVAPDLSGEPRWPCDRLGYADIDLNRDFPIHWMRVDNDEEVRTGPSPLTHKSSQLLLKLVDEMEPEVFFSLHDGLDAVYGPWDGAFLPPPVGIADPCCLRDLAGLPPHVPCGAGAVTSSYVAFGTAVDFVTTRAHKSLRAVATLEVGEWVSGSNCMARLDNAKGLRRLVRSVSKCMH